MDSELGYMIENLGVGLYHLRKVGCEDVKRVPPGDNRMAGQQIRVPGREVITRAPAASPSAACCLLRLSGRTATRAGYASGRATLGRRAGKA